jgi:hypothetical protein
MLRLASTGSSEASALKEKIGARFLTCGGDISATFIDLRCFPIPSFRFLLQSLCNTDDPPPATLSPKVILAHPYLQQYIDQDAGCTVLLYETGCSHGLHDRSGVLGVSPVSSGNLFDNKFLMLYGKLVDEDTLLWDTSNLR